ncbi:MAG: acyl-CoA dehydrogenase family protein [bacterium]
MDFELSERQRIVQETARDLAQKDLEPRAAEMDKMGELSLEVVKKMGELNLLGLTLPPPLGGIGLDTVSFAIAIEELSAAYASTGLFLTAHTMASFAILAFGQDPIKPKYLPDLASGKKIGAFAVCEPNAGTMLDIPRIQTFAERQTDGYKINGTKNWISNQETADVYVVLVKTKRSGSPQALSLIVLEKGTPGLSFGKKEDKLGLKGDRVGELVFNDCSIPSENLFASEGGGLEPAMAAGGLGAIGVGATAVGIGKACLDASIGYAKEREAFGTSISNFQAIQLMISDMKVAVETARLAVYRAAWGIDQKDKSPVNIWVARLLATEMANRVAGWAHRIYGTYGYSSEYPIERYSRDARGLSFVYGTQEFIKILLGKTLMGIPLFSA